MSPWSRSNVLGDIQRPGSGQSATSGQIWLVPGRGKRLAGRLLEASLVVGMELRTRPLDLASWQPLEKVLLFGLALFFPVSLLAEFRMRTLLEQDAVVAVHAFRRTRVPWADVQDVRLRHPRSGRARVELVRASSRKVELPAPVTIYPVLKQRLAQAPGNATGQNRRVPRPPSAVAHSRWHEGLESLRWSRGR